MTRDGTLRRSGFKRPVYSPAPAAPLRPVERCGVYGAASNEPVVTPKEAPLRSESYRRWVASFPCAICGISGFSQAAHENVGKGMSMKVCDKRTFPACGPHWGLPGCHYLFDNLIDITRDEARELGAKLVARMQAFAIEVGRPEFA